MKNLLWLFVVLFLFGCNKDEMDNELLFQITDSNYPTSYPKLSLAEQQQKQAEFEQGQVIFSVIDSFGFVGWSFNDDYEIRKQLHSSTFSDIDGLVKAVKTYLVEKSEFTGITDIGELIPIEIKPRFQNYGNTYTTTDSTIYNFLYINFGNQKIEGIEVYNSLLTCMATAKGVYHVFGHWYPEAYIPPTDKVNIELAKTILVDRKLTSQDGWGQKLTHVVSEEDLAEYNKVIYPYIKGNRLELRICWEFNPSHWQIFMDTTTGEVLLEQDFAAYPL